MKRNLLSLISVLLILSMLAGCAASTVPEDPATDETDIRTDPPSQDVPDGEPETEETRLPSGLPEKDLDGFTLTMI